MTASAQQTMVRMRSAKLVLAASVLIAAALVLSACGAGPSSSAAPDLPAPPFGDDDARFLLQRLLYPTSEEDALAVIDHVAGSGDRRFVSVFIELVRGGQLGIWPLRNHPRTSEALQSLSGQGFESWPEWVTWYAGTDLEPPPGFTEWKGELYAGIDPEFRTFFQDSHRSTIRTEEIVWGGVLLDGIPALDQPSLIPAAEATYLEPDDLVFGVSINGDTRAYPLRIADWHEMVNDVVGGVPVSLAYCTLCGAGVLFDTRVGEQTLTFGSSGFLMRSNKLMYDRTTLTLWNQLTGEPVLGPLVDSNVRLRVLPVVLTTWSDWTDQHPATRVLSDDTGFRRTYRPGAAYGSYFAHPGTMFPVAFRRDVLGEKDRVFAITIDGIPKAYPTRTLTREAVVNDRLGETNLVVIAARGDLQGAGIDNRDGPATWRAGAEVRAFERGPHTFAPTADANTLRDEAGAAWQVSEDALRGPGGALLPRLPAHLAYWFGWFNFFPHTSIYGEDP